MPTGWYFGEDFRTAPPQIGKPRRDRSKNKAQKRARKVRR